MGPDYGALFLFLASRFLPGTVSEKPGSPPPIITAGLLPVAANGLCRADSNRQCRQMHHAVMPLAWLLFSAAGDNRTFYIDHRGVVQYVDTFDAEQCVLDFFHKQFGDGNGIGPDRAAGGKNAAFGTRCVTAGVHLQNSSVGPVKPEEDDYGVPLANSLQRGTKLRVYLDGTPVSRHIIVPRCCITAFEAAVQDSYGI